MQTSTEINKEEIFKENSLKNLYNNFKNKSNDIVHNHNSLIIIFSFILTIYPIFFNDKANIVYETTKELENKSKETYLIKVKNNGDINLRDIDFDSNFPWGIEVINGKFLNKDFLVAEGGYNGHLTNMTSGEWSTTNINGINGAFFMKYPTYIGGFNYEFDFK